jgi:hypothetical protein
MFFGNLFGDSTRARNESGLNFMSNSSKPHTSPSASELRDEGDEEQPAPAKAHNQFEPSWQPLGSDVGTSNTNSVDHVNDGSMPYTSSKSTLEPEAQRDEEQPAPAKAHNQFEPSRLPSGSNVGIGSISRGLSSIDAMFSSPAVPAPITPPHPPEEPFRSPSAASFALSTPTSAATGPHEDGVLAWMFGGSITASPPPPQQAQPSSFGREEAKAGEKQRDSTKARRGLSL